VSTRPGSSGKCFLPKSFEGQSEEEDSTNFRGNQRNISEIARIYFFNNLIFQICQYAKKIARKQTLHILNVLVSKLKHTYLPK